MINTMPFAKEIKQQYLPKPMLIETRPALFEQFKTYNEKFAESLNCDLSH